MSGLCRLALFLALAAAAIAIPTLNLPTEEPPHVAAALEDTLHAEFVAWKSKFAKMYEGVEHSERFAVFKANLKKIAEHNKLYEAGEETFHMAVNQFADMTSEEFAAWSKKANGYRADLRDANLKSGANQTIGSKCTHRSVGTVPTSIDWRTKGAVTNVKNQGQCGSCWAFSTTGAVEGAWKVSGKPLISVSEEELVQCDKGQDEGCNGGIMENAYEWIIKNGGLTSEEAYPYNSGTGTTGVCKKKLINTRKFTSQIIATSPRTTRRTWRRRSRSSLLLLRLRPTRPRSSFTRVASSRLRSVASSSIMASSRWATVWTPRPR